MKQEKIGVEADNLPASTASCTFITDLFTLWEQNYNRRYYNSIDEGF